MDEDVFEIERILETSVRKGVRYYWVRWKGFGEDEDTWEPEENLIDCKVVLENYWNEREKNKQTKVKKRKSESTLQTTGTAKRKKKTKGRTTNNSTIVRIDSGLPKDKKVVFTRSRKPGRPPKTARKHDLNKKSPSNDKDLNTKGKGQSKSQDNTVKNKRRKKSIPTESSQERKLDLPVQANSLLDENQNTTAAIKTSSTFVLPESPVKTKVEFVGKGIKSFLLRENSNKNREKRKSWSSFEGSPEYVPEYCDESAAFDIGSEEEREFFENKWYVVKDSVGFEDDDEDESHVGEESSNEANSSGKEEQKHERSSITSSLDSTMIDKSKAVRTLSNSTGGNRGREKVASRKKKGHFQRPRVESSKLTKRNAVKCNGKSNTLLERVASSKEKNVEQSKKDCVQPETNTHCLDAEKSTVSEFSPKIGAFSEKCKESEQTECVFNVCNSAEKGSGVNDVCRLADKDDKPEAHQYESPTNLEKGDKICSDEDADAECMSPEFKLTEPKKAVFSFHHDIERMKNKERDEITSVQEKDCTKPTEDQEEKQIEPVGMHDSITELSNSTQAFEPKLADSNKIGRNEGEKNITVCNKNVSLPKHHGKSKSVSNVDNVEAQTNSKMSLNPTEKDTISSSTETNEIKVQSRNEEARRSAENVAIIHLSGSDEEDDHFAKSLLKDKNNKRQRLRLSLKRKSSENNCENFGMKYKLPPVIEEDTSLIETSNHKLCHEISHDRRTMDEVKSVNHLEKPISGSGVELLVDDTQASFTLASNTSTNNLGSSNKDKVVGQSENQISKQNVTKSLVGSEPKVVVKQKNDKKAPENNKPQVDGLQCDGKILEHDPSIRSQYPDKRPCKNSKSDLSVFISSDLPTGSISCQESSKPGRTHERKHMSPKRVERSSLPNILKENDVAVGDPGRDLLSDTLILLLRREKDARSAAESDLDLKSKSPSLDNKSGVPFTRDKAISVLQTTPCAQTEVKGTLPSMSIFTKKSINCNQSSLQTKDVVQPASTNIDTSKTQTDSARQIPAFVIPESKVDLKEQSLLPVSVKDSDLVTKNNLSNESQTVEKASERLKETSEEILNTKHAVILPEISTQSMDEKSQRKSSDVSQIGLTSSETLKGTSEDILKTRRAGIPSEKVSFADVSAQSMGGKSYEKSSDVTQIGLTSSETLKETTDEKLNTKHGGIPAEKGSLAQITAECMDGKALTKFSNVSQTGEEKSLETLKTTSEKLSNAIHAGIPAEESSPAYIAVRSKQEQLTVVTESNRKLKSEGILPTRESSDLLTENKPSDVSQFGIEGSELLEQTSEVSLNTGNSVDDTAHQKTSIPLLFTIDKKKTSLLKQLPGASIINEESKSQSATDEIAPKSTGHVVDSVSEVAQPISPTTKKTSGGASLALKTLAKSVAMESKSLASPNETSFAHSKVAQMTAESFNSGKQGSNNRASITNVYSNVRYEGHKKGAHSFSWSAGESKIYPYAAHSPAINQGDSVAYRFLPSYFDNPYMALLPTGASSVSTVNQQPFSALAGVNWYPQTRPLLNVRRSIPVNYVQRPRFVVPAYPPYREFSPHVLRDNAYARTLQQIAQRKQSETLRQFANNEYSSPIDADKAWYAKHVGSAKPLISSSQNTDRYQGLSLSKELNKQKTEENIRIASLTGKNNDKVNIPESEGGNDYSVVVAETQSSSKSKTDIANTETSIVASASKKYDLMVTSFRVSCKTTETKTTPKETESIVTATSEYNEKELRVDKYELNKECPTQNSVEIAVAGDKPKIDSPLVQELDQSSSGTDKSKNRVLTEKEKSIAIEDVLTEVSANDGKTSHSRQDRASSMAGKKTLEVAARRSPSNNSSNIIKSLSKDKRKDLQESRDKEKSSLKPMSRHSPALKETELSNSKSNERKESRISSSKSNSRERERGKDRSRDVTSAKDRDHKEKRSDCEKWRGKEISRKKEDSPKTSSRTREDDRRSRRDFKRNSELEKQDSVDSEMEFDLDDYSPGVVENEKPEKVEKIVIQSGIPTAISLREVKAAIKHGDSATVLASLAGGMNVDSRDSVTGMSLLMRAVSAGQENIVKLLLNHGANINMRDATGNTPLIEACEQGFENIVSLLLNAEIDINAKQTQSGETALIKACMKGHYSVVATLLAHGADCQMRSVSGLTAAQLAVQCGHFEIRDLLESHSKKLQNCVETAIASCLCDSSKLMYPPLLPFVSLYPSEGQRFTYHFHCSNLLLSKTILLFCLRAVFSRSGQVDLSFSKDNGVHTVLLNGSLQSPVLNNNKSVFVLQPKLETNRLILQTYQSHVHLLVCIYAADLDENISNIQST